MKSLVVCRGCRSVLLYLSGAAKVSCALCSTVTSIPPPGMDMDHLICGNCKTLLMYERGAKTVKCTCCDKVNLAPALKCWIASKNTANAVASPEPVNVDDLEKRFASLQRI